MRAVIGLALLSGLALTGIEHVTAGLSGLGLGLPVVPAASVAPVTATGPVTTLVGPAAVAALSAPQTGPRSIFQTVAVSDDLPVRAAPVAAQATPIVPIVAPVKKAPPKPVVADTKDTPKDKAKATTPKTTPSPTKTATATTVTIVATTERPGFKLSCTAEQRLDTVKKRCIPLKGPALANAGKDSVR
jgi:hypothetical protein